MFPISDKAEDVLEVFRKLGFSSNIKDNESRLYLHDNRIKIYYPVIKKDILFETSTPNEFKKIMGK